jgi:hypothetical protein
MKVKLLKTSASPHGIFYPGEHDFEPEFALALVAARAAKLIEDPAEIRVAVAAPKQNTSMRRTSANKIKN